MISLRNRGKYPKAIREEFEHFASRLSVFLGQIFDEDGNYIDRDGNVLVSQEEGADVASSIPAIHHESVAFGSTEESKTVNVQAFAGFTDATEDEVFFELHGPRYVIDSDFAVWQVWLDPTTFPSITFHRDPMIRPIDDGAAAHSGANLGTSSHSWSMWRRRSE